MSLARLATLALALAADRLAALKAAIVDGHARVMAGLRADLMIFGTTNAAAFAFAALFAGLGGQRARGATLVAIALGVATGGATL